MGGVREVDPSTNEKAGNAGMSEYDDKAAIIEVLNLYGFALDARAWELFDRVFSEDVVADFGPAGAQWTGLVDFKRSFAEFHDTLDNHQHTMMGHLVHVDGDKANAFSFGNWLLVRESAQDGSRWFGTGWYDDELVRTDRGWRISHRVCRLISWTGNPYVPIPNAEHRPDMATNTLNHDRAAGKIRFFNALMAKA